MWRWVGTGVIVCLMASPFAMMAATGALTNQQLLFPFMMALLTVSGLIIGSAFAIQVVWSNFRKTTASSMTMHGRMNWTVLILLLLFFITNLFVEPNPSTIELD